MANAILSPDVAEVLGRSTITGNVLVLPPGQLERKLYESVNKALVNAGGKWTRGKGHVFTSDPRAKLGLMLETGVSEDEQQKFQAFYTPSALAARVVELADVSGCRVLEPSAGEGALIMECLAQGAREIIAVELNPEAWGKLVSIFPTVNSLPRDFLQCTWAAGAGSGLFDRVVMNPPFTKGQDVKHVLHALKFLKPGGRCVAIVSAGSRTEEKLRPLSASWEEIPAGTFKSEGTNVKTVLATFIA